jgi:glutaredoxin
MILYSKPGCGLCDKAKALLAQARLEYREVNVLEDEAAMRLYAFEIPVLTDENGRELLKGNFTEAKVAALLMRL